MKNYNNSLSFQNMEDKVVKITYQYSAKEVCVVRYIFNPSSKDLTVAVEGGNSVLVNGIDKRDMWGDVRIKMCEVIPEALNGIGAPIDLIESFILDKFLGGSEDVNKLNDAIFNEKTFQLTLNSGKVIKLPTSGFAYFDLSLDRLLQ
jgi:hypothetical protein